MRTPWSRRGGRGGRAGPEGDGDDAPPITLEQSYERCRRLSRRHGTTYHWSTLLLPRIKRHHVHALYAFCRYADDIVDEPVTTADGADPTADRAAALAAFGDRFFADLDRGRSDDPVLKAVVHTVRAFAIDPGVLPPLPALDDDGPHRRPLRDVGGPARLHGRLGRGRRRDDAAHPRTTRSGRRGAARPGPGRRLPADQLPARRRRGPRPRSRLPAPGGPPPLRRRPRAPPGDAGVVRGHALRDRPLPRGSTSRPTSASGCCRTGRPRACGPPACSTARSSRSSRPRTTTCSRSGRGSRPGRRRRWWGSCCRRSREPARVDPDGRAGRSSRLRGRRRRRWSPRRSCSGAAGGWPRPPSCRGLAVTTGAAAVRRWGRPRALVAAATIAAATTAIERLGTTTGRPFGRVPLLGSAAPDRGRRPCRWSRPPGSRWPSPLGRSPTRRSADGRTR